MAEEIVDVVIIGSGHSGGAAAKVLAEKGISCLMLNAGPVADARKDAEVRHTYALPFRGFKEPGRLPHILQSTEFNTNTWVDERQVPYTFDSGAQYNWARVRLFGGRSLFWGCWSFRFSDFEFKAKSHDGYGDDWPISLADLAPYYSRVESLFRVQGRTEGLPQYPDGNFIPDDSPWSGSMERFVAAGKKMGIPVCKPRMALGKDGLASSVNLFLPDAFATGKLRAIPNVVVRELRLDKDSGLAREVHFVDRLSGREMSVKARVVVVAAGALESTRLLLNSQIANSSGVLGHYLMDQIYGTGITCSVPEARDGKGGPNMMGGNALIPRFRNIDSKSKDFIRGYAMIAFSKNGPMDAQSFGLYGEELENKMESYNGSGFSTTLMGEVLARYEHHVRINKDVVDAWGIPVLHVSTKYTGNELALSRDAVETSVALAEAAGFDVLVRNYEHLPVGYSIHEIGTCRMGDDPKTSVLNKWNQSHDVKNLFVVDGSCFVSSGWQNPTLTITALAMRSAEYLAEEMRKGNV